MWCLEIINGNGQEACQSIRWSLIFTHIHIIDIFIHYRLDHYETECKYNKLIICNNCKKIFNKKKYIAHEKECIVLNKIKCLFCLKEVKFVSLLSQNQNIH